MITVTKRPLVINGATVDVGETIPPAIFNKMPGSARMRMLTKREVDCDFKDGEERPESISVSALQASTIKTNDQLVAELEALGIKVPHNTAQRILWLVQRVVVEGLNLTEEAESLHMRAVLPDWVPDDFRVLQGMSFDEPAQTMLTGARQNFVEGQLDAGVQHTTHVGRDNHSTNSAERITAEEQKFLDPILVEQMKTIGNVVPATAQPRLVDDEELLARAVDVSVPTEDEVKARGYGKDKAKAIVKEQAKMAAQQKAARLKLFGAEGQPKADAVVLAPST
jgi:hypothetical protein